MRKVQMVTDRELEILKILWTHGRASVREVQDDLIASTGPVAYSTVQTLLNIMEEKKGLVRHVVEGRLAFDRHLELPLKANFHDVHVASQHLELAREGDLLLVAVAKRVTQ